MNTRYLCAVTLWVCLGTGQSYAALLVDGDLSDWGVTVGDNNTSVYNFLPGIGLLGSHLEDQGDNDGEDSLLGPNFGGQNYDAEAMAVALQDNTLYIMIVTGQRPDNGFADYAPGDLRIITNGGTFGVEIGGGIGGGVGSLITAGAPGSTYTLDGDGYAVAYADADPLQTAGSVWSNVNWLLDPISPFGPTAFAITGASNLVGSATYVFTRDTATTQHSIIELSIPLSFLAGGALEQVSWRPTCGNDELDVTDLVIPEPATLTLLGLFSLPLIRRNRRRLS